LQLILVLVRFAADPPAVDTVIGTIIEMHAADMVDIDPADDIINPIALSGALWDYFPSRQASGTGVFDTYLAVHHQGNHLDERGFNTGLKGEPCNNFDEDDSKTSALPLNAVPIVMIDSVQYREFCCDINEVSGIPDQYLSLEVLQIWQSDSHNLCGTYAMSPDYKFTPGPRLVYDLDCEENRTLILDYGVNTGSGKPDYKVFVPNAWFDQELDYVIMVVDHGNIEALNPGTKRNPSPYLGWGCSDGFEEWGVRVVECCNDFPVPPNDGSTVDCPDDTDAVPTPPTVNDSCGNPITPTGPVVSAKPVCEGTRTYTWTYSVCEGAYTHNWVYTYTVVRDDFTVPANGGSTVDCPDDTDTPPTPPTVYDDCGATLTLSAPVVSTKPTCEGTRTYTYTYTDCAGHSHNWVYTFTCLPCPPTCSTAVAAQTVPGETLFGDGQSNWFTYITYTKGSGPKTYPIYTQIDKLAGTLEVKDDGTHLSVKYTITNMDSCMVQGISEYHLQVDKSLGDLKTAIVNNSGNPVPGKCEYAGTADPLEPFTTGWIECDQDDISGTGWGDTIYIFAHAIGCWYCP